MQNKLMKKPYMPKPVTKLVVDPRTGAATTSVDFDGVPARVFRLESAQAMQYAAYKWIEADLKAVIWWIDEAHAHMPSVGKIEGVGPDTFVMSDADKVTAMRLKGLFFAAVNLYARCFAQTEGRKIKLDKARLDGKFHDTHEWVIKLRNTVTAHAGVTMSEQSHTYMAVGEKTHEGKQPIYIDANVSTASFVDDRTTSVPFRDLVEHVLSKVEEKAAKLSEDLIRSEEVRTYLFGPNPGDGAQSSESPAIKQPISSDLSGRAARAPTPWRFDPTKML